MSAAPAASRFDPAVVPLDGLQLVEASAGTGKTHAITRLHLRLVLERRLAIDHIVVVTYTVAATEQLRSKIRGLLLEAEAAFTTGETDDPFLRQLLARTCDRTAARLRLTNALRSFDQAAIFTIHGFCQRVLADGAFESASPFETEVVPDERELLQEIIDDFWRRELYAASPLFADFVLGQQRTWTPEQLLIALQPHLGKPDLHVLAPEDVPDPGELEAAATAAYDRARALWADSRDAVAAALASPSLKKNVYREGAIPLLLEKMDAFLGAGGPGIASFQRFSRFTAGELAGSCRKGHPPPQHPFFDACEALHRAATLLTQTYEVRLRAAKVRLLAFCADQLERRKRRRRLMSYDDLLRHLERALRGPAGDRLAATIRERYAAALIDEFQDTDPVQYRIFQRVWGDGAPLLLVGDPKQAIYSFRGADIFAYLAARAAARRRHALDVNWRSDPGLITAVNAVFARARHPFLLESIPFQAAEPAERPRDTLAVDGAPFVPMRLWHFGRDVPGKLVSKEAVRVRAARATAAEVARLLRLGAEGRATIGGQPLDGGDVAVLVRSHREGRMVREALLRLGVPSVEQAQDSVFHTREATELERVLLAVAEPGQDALLRAALVTEMLGGDGASLHALNTDDVAWAARVERFHEYQRLWSGHGFMRMLRELLVHEAASARLLGYGDGERRLTNVLHLGELLQEAAVRRGGGIEGLLKWMAERRRAAHAESEEQQLRLESDQHLVQIVTVHKSKGLEYPVVFCPFVWDGRVFAERAADVAFHDPAHGDRPTLAIGSAPKAPERAQACREEMAEALRLFYVALTRARHHLTLVWGPANDAPTSPLSWLLHAPPGTAAGVAELRSHLRGLDDAAMRADIEALVARAAGTVLAEPLPAAFGVPYRSDDDEAASSLEPRRLSRPLPAAWRVVSFTALAAGREGEAPDYDAGRWMPAEVEPMPAHDDPARRGSADISAFPRGARAGSCLHAIFETVDFTDPDARVHRAVVERRLREHGFDAVWVPAVSAMLERVLATPLDQDGDVLLARVPPRACLRELEFWYPLDAFESPVVRRLVRAHGFGDAPFVEAIERLDFARTAGFMKGYIDLVFESDRRWWLVDFKSNWLGTTPEDYAPARLREVIAREGYWLQYLVYTLALHRLLRLRLPGYDYDRHVAGVRYLFLRGMDPAHGMSGVFADRPSRALIEALDAHAGGPAAEDGA